ncbi:class I SAM-dependent methyltransferase [Leucobacter sp. BZR 635]
MNSALVSSLRNDLLAAGYSLSGLSALWGRSAEDARRRGVFQPALRVLEQRDTTALVTLGRLFLLGEAASRAELDEALPELGGAGAEALGLVRGAIDRTGGTEYEANSERPAMLRAALSLNPVDLVGLGEGAVPGGAAIQNELWIISDLDDELRRGPARPDHVMGVGGATRTLLAQIPPVHAGSALDLGTGCGIVALHLAQLGITRIVATDISARALTLARANAALNALDGRIEFREGSLFEPVAHEQYDLIVSNPPFVITPRGSADAERYEYRDGGMTGDDLAATVVRGGPQYLSAGGTLVCLANWETEWGGHGLERVGGWVRDAATQSGAALDAWVIERDRVDTVQYAETWARDGGARPGQPEFDTLLTGWLDDFGARRIVSIGLGAIHLRRRDLDIVDTPASDSVIHLEQATGALAQAGLGGSLRRAFDAGAAAARASDEAVLATRWIRDAAVTEERSYTPGSESPSAISLVTDEPIARRVVADTLLAAAVGVCDGELTLGQIADALATLLEVDTSAAAEALAAGVRELAWFGMLAPARS